MSKIICEKEELTAVADAIRAKTDTTAQMSLGEMATNVMGISGGGGSAENGFNIAQLTGDNMGTLEFAVGSWENVLSNPASLVLMGAPIPLTYKRSESDTGTEVFLVYCGEMIMGGATITFICRVDANGNYTLSVEQDSSSKVRGLKTQTFASIEEMITAIVSNGYEPYKAVITGGQMMVNFENGTGVSISEGGVFHSIDVRFIPAEIAGIDMYGITLNSFGSLEQWELLYAVSGDEVIGAVANRMTHLDTAYAYIPNGTIDTTALTAIELKYF